MRRPIIIYLWLAAVSEAIFLLMTRTSARNSLQLLKYNQSQGENVTIPFTAEFTQTVQLVALIFPLTLIGLALAYTFGKLKESKTAIHAFGLSIFACAVISMWSNVVATMPWIGGVITEVNDPASGNKTSPEVKQQEPRLSAPVPSDGSDAPSYLDNLYYLGQQDYILQFIEIRDSERVKVLRHSSGKYESHGYILRAGETSHDGQFRIDDYQEHKQSPESYSLKNSATLFITYLPDGRKFQLKRKEKIIIPTHLAHLRFLLGGEDESKEIYVKKDGTFKLPIFPEIDYKLSEVTADMATISYKDIGGLEHTREIGLNKPE